jgi:hypothetical protein
VTSIQFSGTWLAYKAARFMRMETTGTVRVGDRVSFSISEVFLPEPSEVLANLTADVRTEGVVVEFSDSGSVPRAYAMVRITPQQMVLLPISALRVLNCP